ncbi:phosphate ABC transporter substrate-binding protein [Vibrio sp. SCSIO 43140]|uniref:phosphate ABC transporter substrate-binding protein n=1 Tax=Vibrio sp. SCSIO 43140 TaxID=2819100 RepID=UPI002074F70C|nr:phosphate ABC transporter substrate-binding protein [Vibrio sp. SCSIO 43140]USD62420.1 phosphate ABC transporter substrate-binding protein [Vibrio sp. SCSIO 43140]
MKKIATLALVSLMSFAANAGYVVIGNPAGVDAMSDAEVKQLFLGKKTQLANGQPVKIIELNDGNADRIAFHEATTGRSEAQLQSAWSRLVFTGKAEAPTQVADYAAVIGAVAADANAIGYVDESAVDGSVKVLIKY